MYLHSLFQVQYDFIYDQKSELAVPVSGNTYKAFSFPGLFLWEDFVPEDEEKELVAKMDQDVWRESQSGRRKQVLLPKGRLCTPCTLPGQNKNKNI